jgi:hypothetical protein
MWDRNDDDRMQLDEDVEMQWAEGEADVEDVEMDTV